MTRPPSTAPAYLSSPEHRQKIEEEKKLAKEARRRKKMLEKEDRRKVKLVARSVRLAKWFASLPDK